MWICVLSRSLGAMLTKQTNEIDAITVSKIASFFKWLL